MTGLPQDAHPRAPPGALSVAAEGVGEGVGAGRGQRPSRWRFAETDSLWLGCCEGAVPGSQERASGAMCKECGRVGVLMGCMSLAAWALHLSDSDVDDLVDPETLLLSRHGQPWEVWGRVGVSDKCSTMG